MKLLIMSDTHGMNSKQWQNVVKIEKADINIHAGDYLIPISEMKKYFQYFVDGNNDYGHKDIEEFEIQNFKFLLVHGHQHFNWEYDSWINETRQESNIDADIIIFGHSHIPLIDTSSKPYFVNPGSFSLPRNNNKKTYIIATIGNNTINFKLKFWD